MRGNDSGSVERGTGRFGSRYDVLDSKCEGLDAFFVTPSASKRKIDIIKIIAGPEGSAMTANAELQILFVFYLNRGYTGVIIICSIHGKRNTLG